ncbi:sulfite exporter TauE/SafE family protein [Rhodobacteraceae bacterium NNCM2]|nr:sulfite exporter TauE/SafE family protein [Coraliihabitans acroporae]
MSFDAGTIALLLLVFLLAGTIKGTVGIGLPTAAVGMMSQVIDPRAAIALVVVPSLVTNLWQIIRSGKFVEAVRRYSRFLVCLVAMILIVSIAITSQVATDTLILVLGIVIVGFSVMSLAWKPPFLPPRLDGRGQIVAGALAGTMGGMTAIWAPPMVIYLTARQVEKDEFVRATGVIIFTGTLPLLAGFLHSGLMTGSDMMVGAALTLPALAGFQIGERIRRRLNTDRFREAVLIIFLLLGLNLIRRAFM